jgi:predicted nucleic acid-binding protein
LSSSAQVVLDADFLSAFLKIERLSIVRELLGLGPVFTPPAVYREISVTDLLPRLAAISWIEVREPDAEKVKALGRDEAFARLGSGEREAIALCQELGDVVLLMNDNKAGQVAGRLGIRVFSVPTFLLAYKDSGLASQEQIADLVTALEERDFYGFRKDVRDLLLT